MTVWSSSQSAHRAARAARADPRAARARDPRDRPGRRRRLRLQGHAAGRDAAGRRWPRSSWDGRSSGSRTGARTCSRRRRGAGSARRSSWRSTPTGGSSALRGRILADLGAYLLPSTAIPPHTTAMLLSGCYDIPAVEVIVTGARTNKVPTAPYRGAGRPEATYLIETTIDAAARAARGRRARAAPAQPRALVPLPDRARVDVRLRRLRALPGHGAGAARPAGRTRRFARPLARRSRPGRRRPRSRSGARRSRGRRRRRAVERRDVLVGVGVALCVERSGGLFEHATVRRAARTSS